MFKRRVKSSDKKHEELFIHILTFFSESERYFTADMPLADIVTENFDERNLVLSISSLELTMGVNITVEMIELGKLSGMTIGEFARAAARLPAVRDDLQIARFVQFADQVIESLMPEGSEGEWMEMPRPED
jgi:hypothetical protein